MRGNFDYNCFTPGMTDQGCKSELSVYSFDWLFVTAKVLGFNIQMWRKGWNFMST